MKKSLDLDSTRARDVADFTFLLPVLWLLLVCAFTYAVVLKIYRESEANFKVQSVALREHLSDHLLSSEAVLEGFSALLDVQGEVDTGKARRYAEEMRSRYPHIFMLEIAKRITHRQRHDFEQSMVRAGYADFKVRSFRYEDARSWSRPPDKAVYYPIVFIDPMSPQSRQVLGLDIDSVPFLKSALSESQRHAVFIASEPFKLIEGDWAYVMHRAVGSSRRLVALLVVKANALLKAEDLPLASGLQISLRHRQFDEQDPRGLILKLDSEVASPLESRFLPGLCDRFELGGSGQPFALEIRRQLRWTDFNLPLLAGVTTINLVTLAMLVWYALTKRRIAAAKRKQAKQWAYLASHDQLTGLPNRFLLMDRIDGAMRRAQRDKSVFALIFLDLNRFKQINDRYGHHVGDQVLKYVASVIETTLRADDSVARISGDEFVAVLEGVADRAQAEAVGNKILLAMPQSLEPDYPDLYIGISFGIAMYPQDGSDADALLKSADAAMYRMKSQTVA